MLFPTNDLSLHMVWAHLLSEVEYQEKTQEVQKQFAVTVHGLLREAGIPISRESVICKYKELIED
jgi:hypothetical protein